MDCDNCVHSRYIKQKNNRTLFLCEKAKMLSSHNKHIEEFKILCNNRKVDSLHVSFAFRMLAWENKCPFLAHKENAPEYNYFFENKDRHFFCDNRKCLWTGKGEHCLVDIDRLMKSNENNLLCPNCQNAVQKYI